MDKYEASAWSIPAGSTSLIKRVQNGTATLADLMGGGAQQFGDASYNTGGCSSAVYPSTFPITGNWTAPLYAVSIPGVFPSTCVSWFQAEQLCRLSGKRLITNQEWQAAAAGTPDPGTDNGTTDCAILTGRPVNTGSRSACISNWGTMDMVGNVAERTADWGDHAQGCTTWPSPFGNGDSSCVGDATATGPTLPGTWHRGGDWNRGALAGVFAMDQNDPTVQNGGMGFRCAR